jgi:hypothetical protein
MKFTELSQLIMNTHFILYGKINIRYKQYKKTTEILRSQIVTLKSVYINFGDL